MAVDAAGRVWLAYRARTPFFWSNVGTSWFEFLTCYEGDRTHRHAWGYGCGVCPACELRARGYAGYIAP